MTRLHHVAIAGFFVVAFGCSKSADTPQARDNFVADFNKNSTCTMTIDPSGAKEAAIDCKNEKIAKVRSQGEGLSACDSFLSVGFRNAM
jgi:hypothetical protein